MTSPKSLMRGVAFAMMLFSLGMTAVQSEALPIPIGARLRLTGPGISRKHMIGVLVGFGESSVQIRVSGSEVLAFPIAGIETVEVAEGKVTSWRRVAVMTAAGAGFALALHGPQPVGDDPFNFFGGRTTFCGDYDFLCTFHPARDRAIAVGLFGLGGLAGRKVTHWVQALPADLARPRADRRSAPSGPPQPEPTAAAPPVNEGRAGTRVRLNLADGKSVKGTLTSISATQWTIHGDDGTMQTFDRQRVTRVMEADGRKRHWREGAMVGVVLGSISGLADAAGCDGCSKSGHVASRVAGAVVADALLGLCIKSEKWKPFTGDGFQEHAGGPSVQVEPNVGRRGIGVNLRLAW